MKRIFQACRDARGTAAIEFAVTAPIFFAMIVGIMVTGLVLWSKFGLQHAAEMAARCASIDTINCNSTTAIQTYAVKQTFGIKPPASTFVVSVDPLCGNKVTANYSFTAITYMFGVPGITLSAAACFPA
jgi:Flp pilus assembly protein TadG